MRVNFVGNVCNNHYVLAKGLRAAGVDVHLFLEAHRHPQTDPAAEDPQLAGDLPDWIHILPDGFRPWAPVYRLPRVALEVLGQCDLLHVHGLGTIWAAQTGRPFVWHPYGEDIASWTRYHADLLVSRSRSIPLPRVWNLPLPLKMRWAIRRANAVLLGWHNRFWQQAYELMLRLGIEERFCRFHLAVDAEKFRAETPDRKQRLRQALFSGAPIAGPLIFHPTRVMFSRPDSPLGYKANDRFFRALGRLAAQGSDFSLVITEKGIPDERLARQMIAELGYTDKVRWVPAMPRHELISWYQASDLTVESFYAGAIGSVPLEAMACGSAVMMHLQTQADSDDKFFLDPLKLYPELPPIIRCRTDEEIFSQLQNIALDKISLGALGVQGRAWVERHASVSAAVGRLLEIYRTVLRVGQ